MSEQYHRLAIVTGATSGIGEATVRKFISAGIGVVGNGRNHEKLSALEKELGSAFHGVSGDAADPSTLDKLFLSVNQHFGQSADIVVANAGQGLGGSVKEADLEKFEHILKINVTGTLALLQKGAKQMIKDRSAPYPESPADIVVVGSIVGRHISPFSGVYGATKFAVHALAEALRRELAGEGVRVSLVEPGFVLSGFQAGAGYSDQQVEQFKNKFGPLLEGEDIANAIHFIVTQPPSVHISDIVVRPTRQDYP